MNYMEEAIKEANLAFEAKEVPIGAVIVMKNQIIARSHNERIASNDVTNHAEISAIKKAANYINDWRLNGCDLYVTVEPCAMCMEVIKASRIDNVYYLLPKLEEKQPYSRTNMCLADNEQLATEYKYKISEFFKLNCNR